MHVADRLGVLRNRARAMIRGGTFRARGNMGDGKLILFVCQSRCECERGKGVCMCVRLVRAGDEFFKAKASRGHHAFFALWHQVR